MTIRFIEKKTFFKDYKVSISKRVFDWLCFLNNISSCYSRKKKTKKKIYFSQNDFKKIKKNDFSDKIFQINDWKKILKNFKTKSKLNKISSALKNLPFYKFDVILKNKIVFFYNIFSEVKNLFSFIVMSSQKKR